MKKKNILLRTFFSFAWWYKISCNYGESHTRPMILLGVVLGIATFVFFLDEVIKETSSNFTNFYSNSTIMFVEDNFDSTLYNATKRSVSTLTPFFELQKTELSDYVFRLLTLPLLGTLFISLRRKLERKFRH